MKHTLGSEARAIELPTVYEVNETLVGEHPNDDYPTEEEIMTLPRTTDKIPWRIYTVAFVELCERFSYYGTQIFYKSSSSNPWLRLTVNSPEFV